MNSLAKFDCTLRTLRLNFDSSEEISLIDETSWDGSSVTSTVTASPLIKFVLQEDFREAVVSLKVESMIKLSITSRRAVYCTIFQELADAIGFRKQWAVVEDPYATPLKPTIFKKQWVLTPYTSASRQGSEIGGRSSRKHEQGSSYRGN